MILAKRETIWIYPKENPELKKKIIDEFRPHPVIAQILVSRGFSKLEDIHDYLYGKLPDLYDPELFPDMDKAVSRVMQAINAKEGILIYGDNDVDGMTATALLVEFFRQVGAKVFFYIPSSNVQKKSGIGGDALRFALQNSCSLFITVDCGITAIEEIKQVVENKIDVIITDHHVPTSKIPHCVATLNPKVEGSTYPNKEITGVGVAFKLAHAILNFLSENEDSRIEDIDLKRALDLVALGTIADMGPLLGENRILVRYGLKQLRKTKRVGLLKLFHFCEINIPRLSPVEIASKVAPRLNSLGRIADPCKGVELLLIRDEEEATKLAQELDIYNIERQKIERLASEDVESYIDEHTDLLKEKAIVLSSHKWHPGIIPIITARIAKNYNRPTVLIAIEGNVGKGSIRTIPEFPLLSILKDSEKDLINFGGHNFAAGLTIKEENISHFKKIFIETANKMLKEEDIATKLYLDAYVDFQELTFDFMEGLSLLEPFGTDNPPPILYCDALPSWAPKLIGKNNLKVYLEQGERVLEGIAFGMANRKNEFTKKGAPLSIAFTPQINTFLNKSSIQLQLKDFKVK